VDEIVNQNWRSLESVIGETVTKHEVQDKLRNHLIMMACTLMSCAAYAVLPHGLALRLRTLVRLSVTRLGSIGVHREIKPVSFWVHEFIS
jgi:hypothetical protein